MSQIHTGTATPIRASDAERDQAAEILRVAYAQGRLTRAELDERTGAAYAAKTRADLHDLISDLPGTVPASPAPDGQPAAILPVLYPDPQSGTGIGPDRCLLLCLLFAFPPTGIVYWVLAARRRPQPTVPERSLLLDSDPPSPEELNHAFWQACHGGQRRTAEYLFARGADINAIPDHSKHTPLDIAPGPDTRREAVVSWLREHGARSAEETPTD